MRNTKQDCQFTLFIYRERKRYIGVCLELDIVDNGNDLAELTDRMKKSVESYVRRVCWNDSFDAALLNRPAPKKYWNLLAKYLECARQLEKTHAASRRPTRCVPLGEMSLITQHLRGLRYA